jgi:hypothetical protein
MSMNLVTDTKRLTADGVVGQSGKPTRVYWILLVSGSTGSTTSLKNGTSGTGTAYVQVDGKANEGVLLNFAGGVRFPDGCYMDTDANISYATIGCTTEF